MQRTHIWETHILPEILDGLPTQAPKAPDDHSQPSQREEQQVSAEPAQQAPDEEQQLPQQSHENMEVENDAARSSTQKPRSQAASQETWAYPATSPRSLRPVGSPTDVLEILDYRGWSRAMRPSMLEAESMLRTSLCTRRHASSYTT